MKRNICYLLSLPLLLLASSLSLEVNVKAENNYLSDCAPTSNVESGTYNAPIEVSLSNDLSTFQIYYTLDGSIPTTSSTLYTAPFTIGTAEDNSEYLLKAVSFKDGKYSDISEYKYTITWDFNIAKKSDISIPKGTNGETLFALSNYGTSPAVDEEILNSIIDGEYGSHTVYIYPYSDRSTQEIVFDGPTYVQLDFKETKVTNKLKVAVYFSFNSFSNVKLQFSNDVNFAPENVTVPFEVNGAVSSSGRTDYKIYRVDEDEDPSVNTYGGYTNILEIDYPDISARYLRLFVTYAPDNQKFCASEIQIFAKKTETQQKYTDARYLLGDNTYITEKYALNTTAETILSDIATKHGNKVDFDDNKGNKINLDVEWRFADTYNAETGGIFNVIGVPKNLPLDLQNPYDVAKRIKVILPEKLNITELQSVINTADSVDKPLYIPADIASLNQAVTNAKKIVADVNANTYENNQIEIDQTTSSLRKLVASLHLIPNKDALNALVTECASITSATYTNSSYSAFTTAYTAADTVNKNENAIESDVTTSLNNLQAAKANLAKLYNKTEYVNYINSLASIDETKYTVTTFNNYKVALDNLKVLSQEDKDYSEAEAAALKTAFEQANNKLQFVGNKEALNTALINAKTYADDLSKYTLFTSSNFEDAYDNAVAISKDNDADQTKVDNAKTQLEDTIQKLVLIGDTTNLEELIRTASEKNKEYYTDVTYEILSQALYKAKFAVGNKEYSQSDVDNAYKTLQDALNNLTENTNGKLANLLEAINTNVGAKAKYTKFSYYVYSQELLHAKTVYYSLNPTVEEINSAITALNESIQSLMEIGSKGSLQEAIDYAESKKSSSNYTEESVKALDEVLARAKAMVKDENVSKEQVNKTYDEVISASDNLQAQSGNSGKDSSSAQQSSSSNSSEQENQELAPKKGCKSMAATPNLALLLGLLGIAILRKKR